jgi:hypothetical protein
MKIHSCDRRCSNVYLSNITTANCTSLNIVREIKHKIVKRAAHVTLMKGMRIELRIFVGKPEIMTQLGIPQHTWVM